MWYFIECKEHPFRVGANLGRIAFVVRALMYLRMKAIMILKHEAGLFRDVDL
jgi:hypothetical protein